MLAVMFRPRSRVISRKMAKVIITTSMMMLFAACSGGSWNYCIVTNCHGMEVTCGYSEPLACTEVYEIGDRCRGYVSCVENSDRCEAVVSPAFEPCRQCVTDCLSVTEDPGQQFICESLCR